MQVMLNVLLVDMDGDVIDDIKMVQGKEVRKPLTLRRVLINALTGMFPDEQNLDGETKLERFELAMKVKNGEEPVDFTPEEVTEMRKLVSKAYGTVVVGQALSILK